VKTLSSFSLQLCIVVILGMVSGGWWARPDSSEPDVINARMAAAHRGSGSRGPADEISKEKQLIHSGGDLADWVRQAGERAAASGLGFQLEMDTPDLLLALERLTVADCPLLMIEITRLPDGAGKRQLQDCLLAAWSRQAPEEAMAWARENRPDRYGEAIQALARKDARAAWKVFQEHPAKWNSTGEPTRTVFSQWAMQNRSAALEALLELETGRVDPTPARMGFFASSLPERAKFPNEWQVACDQITARILEEPDAKGRIGALSALLSEIGQSIPSSREDRASLEARRKELSGWLLALPLAEADQGKLLTAIAQWDGVIPGAAQDAFAWLWQTVPVGQRVEALTSIVENWASDKPWSARDPDGCGRWLNEQGPLGPEFSGALKSFALHAAAKDPESGLAWAQQIADPAIRQDAVQQVKAQILKQWPHRAVGLGVGP
jgi:hypothetical protein